MPFLSQSDSVSFVHNMSDSADTIANVTDEFVSQKNVCIPTLHGDTKPKYERLAIRTGPWLLAELKKFPPPQPASHLTTTPSGTASVPLA
jgi:hypothetical protein